MIDRSGGRLAPWLCLLLAYSLLAALWTWPLAAHVGSGLPHDLGDPLFSTWVLWWNAHVLPLSSQWWNPPIFWPMTGAMALSEHMLGASLVATPLQWLGAGPVAAYNTVVLASFPLCAIAGHMLAYSLTRRHESSAMAGLAFGFGPYRASQIAHLQMLWVFWMPVALVALHMYARDGRGRWLAVFAAAWLGLALSNMYLLLFFPLLVALWIVWFLVRPGSLRRAGAVAFVGACTAAVLLPIAVEYFRVGARLAFERTFKEIVEFSATFGALGSVSPMVAASGVLPTGGNAEQHLFPGFVLVALISVATIEWLSTKDDAGGARRPTATAFAVAGGVAAIAAASTVVAGPWSLHVGTIRVISVSTPQKPLTVALWLWLVAFLSGSRARRAWRTRSPLAFYLMAAAAMYVLSLGPRPTLFGEPIWYSPPFAWLLELPGFSSVRAPARFALPAVLCLAVAGALAFERIRVRLSERGRAAAAAIAIAGVCADGWIRDLPIVALPDPHTAAAALGNQPIVELPLGDTAGDLAVMYRSIYHRRPVVNGYSGFEPVHYRVLRHALQSHDQAALEPVAAHGPLAIVENGRVSTIPHHAFDDAPPHGASLRIDSVTVDGHPLDLAPITDGNRLTSWQSAANQQGTETMVVDMSAVRVVDAVVLRLGVFVDGYPRSLAIDVSEDRRAWTRAWTGRGAGKAVAAALRDPAAVPMTFGFAPVRARWVRLRQLGADPIARWTVADLTVHGR